jgi:hypothetical protein
MDKRPHLSNALDEFWDGAIKLVRLAGLGLDHSNSRNKTLQGLNKRRDDRRRIRALLPIPQTGHTR